MGADASIYSMIRPPVAGPGPIEQMGSMMQLRAMGDSSEFHQLQRKKMVQDMAEEEAFKLKIADWATGGGKGELPPDVWAASPARAQALEKSRLDAEKSRGEIERTRVQTVGDQVTQLRNQLAQVRGDADLPPLRDFMTKIYGPQAAASMPQSVNDPAWGDWQTKGLQTADKLLEFKQPKYETKNDGQKQVLWQINPNAGKVGPVDGAGVITNQMTPEQQDAAKRGWATLTETKRHHGATERQAEATAGVPSGFRRAADGKSLEPIPGGPADQPTTTQKDELTSIARTQSQAARLRAAFKPEFVGFKGSTGEMWDKYGSQMLPFAEGDQERIQFRALAADLENNYIKAISGATVPESEIPRLRRAIPTPSDSPAQYQAKLTAMEENLAGLPNIVRNGAKQVPVDPNAPKRDYGPGLQPQAQQKTFDSMPDPAKFPGGRVAAPDGTEYVSDGKIWKRQRR